MENGPKKSYHHGNLRQSLIDQALLHLKSHGEGDLSLRELAKATNVSANAPYRHFESKDALLAVLAAQGFAALSEKLSEVKEEGPVKQFREVGQIFTDFAVDNGALFRLMFGYRFESADSALNEARSRCFHQIAESVRIACDEVTVNAKVRQRAVAAWSLLYGFASLAIDKTFPLDLAGEAIEGKDVARTLARGLRD